ncbi:hypothetical protein [Bacillus sp. Marseille-Q1617]|uniref:hypothetical protein n=1 Tax=Bacillus sp. Marseille-Q1617 TaxID=2736887 RepID=UPI00158C86A4|nr:hypothetical protein [Bacillus sp. Marseille-Q1617]
MDNVIKRFLQSEIMYQDLYDEIMNFISNVHIRSGEFEGNEFIIKKMDQDNFIIFPEYTFTGESQRDIPYSTSIYRKNLIKEINDYAQVQGIKMK